MDTGRRHATPGREDGVWGVLVKFWLWGAPWWSSGSTTWSPSAGGSAGARSAREGAPLVVWTTREMEALPGGGRPEDHSGGEGPLGSALQWWGAPGAARGGDRRPSRDGTRWSPGAPGVARGGGVGPSRAARGGDGQLLVWPWRPAGGSSEVAWGCWRGSGCGTVPWWVGIAGRVWVVFFFRVGPVRWVALYRDKKVIRMGGSRIAILHIYIYM